MSLFKFDFNLDQVESDLDQKLEKLLRHPLFLQAVGTALNLNSYRRIWMNRALIKSWKLLQLPNKRDQERTLHLINELHHRIAELEAKLEAREMDGDRIAPGDRVSVKIRKKTKAATSAGVDPKLVAVQ